MCSCCERTPGNVRFWLPSVSRGGGEVGPRVGADAARADRADRGTVVAVVAVDALACHELGVRTMALYPNRVSSARKKISSATAVATCNATMNAR